MGEAVAPTKGAISNREMDMFRQASKLANPEISMAPFGSINTSADVQAMRDLAGQTKGAISNAEMQVLEQAQMESGETFTPEEKEMALKKIRELSEKSKAPLFELSERIRMEGEGDDTEIAHVKPGEVIIDPRMIEDDPQFESYLESKFQQYGVQ